MAECGEESAEVYCASLFAKCNPSKDGKVRVSRILETLKTLQGHAAHLEEDEKTCGEALLQEVKEMFDPLNDNPEITLAIFTEGITSYLEKERKRLMPTADEIPSSSNLHRRNAKTRLESLSLEESIESPNEPIIVDDVKDLKSQIADLQLQLRKVSEDNTTLRSNLDAALEENQSFHQTRKEQRAKEEAELRMLVEKVLRLEENMNEKDSMIGAMEEKQLELGQKFATSEKEAFNLQQQLKDAMTETEERKAENAKLLSLLSCRNDTLTIFKTEQDSSVEEWRRKEEHLQQQNNILAVSVKDLEVNVEWLKVEKLELETKVAKLKVELEKRKSRHTISNQEQLSEPEDELDPNFCPEEDGDIGAEIMAAANSDDNGRILRFGRSVPALIEDIDKFDAATQCEELVSPQEEPRWSHFGWILKSFLSFVLLLVLVFVVIILLFSHSLLELFNINIGCLPNSYFKSVEHFFQLCGDISHDYVPII